MYYYPCRVKQYYKNYECRRFLVGGISDISGVLGIAKFGKLHHLLGPLHNLNGPAVEYEQLESVYYEKFQQLIKKSKQVVESCDEELYPFPQKSTTLMVSACLQSNMHNVFNRFASKQRSFQIYLLSIF